MPELIYDFLMRLWMSIQFLTFVVLASAASKVVWAAPSTEISPSQMKPTTPSRESNKRLETDSVHITPVPLHGDEHQDRILATRVVHDQTWNLSLGLVSGPLREKKPIEDTQIYGIGTTLQLPNESAQEYTVDITQHGMVGFHGQFKKYCCLGRYSEPYWTAGAAGLYDPADLLPGIVKLRSYQAQGGVGFEDLFQWQRRLRSELMIGVGDPGVSIYLRIGYAFDESLLNF